MRFPISLAVLLLLALAGPVRAADRPNVVFILADDLGFSDLGCYGGEIATPNLDALAKNGLRFTQCYNTARCWPSRGALLTGYYAQQIHRDKLPGVAGGGVGGARQPWARLLPEFLKSAGYRSYHSGKWHIDGKVLAGGFDRSLNISNPGNFFTARGNSINDVPIKPPADETGYYQTIATADHAVECLKDHAAKHAKSPFFQYIAFHAPHFPLHALPEDIAKYRDRYVDGWDKMRQARFDRQKELGITKTSLSVVERDQGPPYRYPDAIKKLGSGEVDTTPPWNDLTDEQRRFQATKMAIHAAMVDRMDREIGRVIAQLRTMGTLDNTVILFASDNGASSEIMVRDGGHDPAAAPGSAATYLCLGPGFASVCNTPFRRHKTWVHEGGISTPFIVHWPAGIAARGELRNTPAHFIDLVPTVLDLASIEKPKDWKGERIPPAPGKSLVPALAREVTIARDFLWWLHEGHRAIRVGDWKLVAAAGEPWELYDLKSDRAEQKNLAATMAEKTRELGDLWQKQTDATIALIKPPAPPPRPHNLLVITADDMNADSGGWNGSKLGATPNLDAFEKTAHKFVNSHVTVPICQPCRSAFMTGRVPHRNGALGFNPIRRDVPTLVEILRENGYYTAAIAKAVHMAPAEKFPWHAVGEQSLGKQPAKFAEKFRDMLAAAASEKKPFFVNANICDPHRPFISPTAKAEALEGARVYKPEEVTVPAFLEDLPRVREEVAQYTTNVSRFDVTFGLVMKELAAAGRDADTVVVFMSDHGMSFPFSKATVYFNGTWSPVLIRIPGTKEPQTRPELVSSVDVMPSLLELLAVKPPEGMDGRSWLPLLKGQTQADRDFVVTHVNTVSSGKSFGQRCIRTKDRALMFHAWVGGPDKFRVEAMNGLSFAAMNASTDAKIQARVKQLVEGETLMLFDLASDPTERKNVFGDPKYAGDVAELSKKLLAHMKATEDPQTKAFEAALAKK